MGILDDAIREHLDLKRKHGAQEDEVQILEDEAFGPPSRPGDPDFPERPPTGEEAIVEEAPTGTEEPALEDAGEIAIEPVPDEPLPQEEAPPPPPPPVDAPAGFFDQDAGSSVVHEETVEHPAPLPPEDEAPPEPEEAEPIAAEPEAPPAEPGEEAPSGESTEFEVGEIELELDEEFEEFRETGDDAEPEAAAGAPPAPAEAPGEEDAVEEDEGEDVLEETPEFLRDTPEDERLWFEQGEPQDFDFDEDDDEEADR